MKFRVHLIIPLMIFACAACSHLQHATAPLDKEEISYHSFSVGFSIPRGTPRVEKGFVSGTVITPDVTVEPNSIWSDGSHANKVIRITLDELESIKRALTDELNDVIPVYTYSGRHADAEKDSRLGIYYRDYSALVEIGPHVSIRFTGMKDEYYRTMSFSVPLSEVNTEFWKKLMRGLPDNEQFTSLVSGLVIFWINNA